VTDPEVETVVRDAFRGHEHLVADGQDGLLAAVRGRVRRRRTLAVAGTGLATLAVLAGAVALGVPRGSGPGLGDAGGSAGPASSAPASTAPAGTAPAGWRLVSSLGVELIVPEAWGTNDYNCGMTAKPSVVRGQWAELDCYTPEPPTKELAIIERPLGPLFPDIAGHPVSIGGVPAMRADGRAPDGRYAGWVLVGSRDVRVQVRTRSEATTRAILDSIRLVDTDHLGCPAKRPAVVHKAGAGGDFVTPEPAAISICFYKDAQTDRLQASTELTGASTRQLAAALNAARPGPNADPPAGSCLDMHAPVPEVVLLVRAADGGLTTVWVTFSSCAGRGMDNGVRRAQVTQTIVGMFMRPLFVAYGLNGDLPG
jgi:hypothetical protein